MKIKLDLNDILLWLVAVTILVTAYLVSPHRADKVGDGPKWTVSTKIRMDGACVDTSTDKYSVGDVEITDLVPRAKALKTFTIAIAEGIPHAEYCFTSKEGEGVDIATWAAQVAQVAEPSGVMEAMAVLHIVGADGRLLWTGPMREFVSAHPRSEKDGLVMNLKGRDWAVEGPAKTCVVYGTSGPVAIDLTLSVIPVQ